MENWRKLSIIITKYSSLTIILLQCLWKLCLMIVPVPGFFTYGYLLFFLMIPLFPTMDVSRFKNGRIHFRNAGLKGLTKHTFVGHCSVSISVFLTSVNPPISSHPNSPAWWSGTFLIEAGVNPQRALSKLSWVISSSASELAPTCIHKKL